MGNNTKTDHEMVEDGFEFEVKTYEDVFIFMPTGESEMFGVKVSLEVCCQESDTDRRIDLTTDFAEAITRTMVGMYRLTQRAHIQEYKGTLRFTNGDTLEGT